MIVQWIRRVIVAAMLGGGAVLLVAGPRGNEIIPPSRVVVDYWEKWTGVEEQQMRVIVNDFNNTVGKDKGIYVRYLSTGNVVQKTLVATAAGVPPDIAGLYDGNLKQFAAQNAIMPLDDLIANDPSAHFINANYYEPVYWNECHYNGKLYALVSTPAAIALIYNKKIFHNHAKALLDAGLDPDRPPKTIAELDAYAKALTTFDSSGRITLAGYLPTEPGWYLAETSDWFGGHLWDDKAKKFTLTSPAVIRSLTWLRGYSKRLGTTAISQFNSGVGNYDSPQNGFLTGAVAMEQQGPWMANTIQNQNPAMSTVHWPLDVAMTKTLQQRRDNCVWAAAPFPTETEALYGASYCPFDDFMIPNGARHPHEAFEFIKYVSTQPVMEKLCMLHCKNSPLRVQSANFIQHHPNPYIQVFQDLARSPNARSLPDVPIMPEVSDELLNATQRVLLLDATPMEAMENIQAPLQAKYDHFVSVQRDREKMLADAAGAEAH